jgi:hypothetical protein
MIIDNPGVDEYYVNDTVGTVTDVLDDVKYDNQSSNINNNKPSNRRNCNNINKNCYSTLCYTGFTR